MTSVYRHLLVKMGVIKTKKFCMSKYSKYFEFTCFTIFLLFFLYIYVYRLKLIYAKNN